MDKVNTKATGQAPEKKPKSAIGPLTMRDGIVVLGGILVIVGSLFPIPWSKTVSVNMWIFPGLPFHLLIALVLPLLVAGGFLWRRLTARIRVRVGSLSLDQAGSVVGLVSAAYFFNSYVASMSPAYLIGFLGALAMVVGTTLASYFGAFRRDFVTGGETVLGSDLAPVARQGKSAAAGESAAAEEPVAKGANAPSPVKTAARPDKPVTGKDQPRTNAPAKETAATGAAAKQGPAQASTIKPGSQPAAPADATQKDASPKSAPTPAAQASEAAPKREATSPASPAPGSTDPKATTPTSGSAATTPAPRNAATVAGAPSDKASKAKPSKSEAPADQANPAATPKAEGSHKPAENTATSAKNSWTSVAKPEDKAPAAQSDGTGKTPQEVKATSTETGAAKPETDAAQSTSPKDSAGSGASSLEPRKDQDKNVEETAKPASSASPAAESPKPGPPKEKGAATSNDAGTKGESGTKAGTGSGTEVEASPQREDGQGASAAGQAKAPEAAKDSGKPATSDTQAVHPSIPVSEGVQATAALSRADLEAHRAAAEKAKAAAEAESSFGARAESEEPEPVSTSFWFALNHPRPVFHHVNGTMLETLYPGTWFLCVEDRGTDYFINLPDGRPGVLRNLDDLQFPQQ